MSKIYYFKKEIALGEIIEFEGIKVTVTEKLVRDNPDLFSVEDLDEDTIYVNFNDRVYKVREWTSHSYCRLEMIDGSIIEPFKDLVTKVSKEEYEKQCLLDEAKERFPVGTKFKSAYVSSCKREVQNDRFHVYRTGDIVVNESSGPSVYHDGKWAKKYLFTTEDGVEIYEDEKYWYIRGDEVLYISLPLEGWDICKVNDVKRFSTREAAEEYIAKHKEKSLEDYESILLDNGDTIKKFRGTRDVSVTYGAFYKILKETKSTCKLYYLKVLQLIADDLNGGWKVDWYNSYQEKYYANKHRGKYRPIRCFRSSQGTVIFFV